MMIRLKTLTILSVLIIMLLAADTLGFRLFTPSSNTSTFSRPSWEAGPNNWPFRPAGMLNLTINGMVVTVNFGAGGVNMTAQQVANMIQAAIDAQAPGSATVTVVGTSLGTGTIQIVPTTGTITNIGGLANTNIQLGSFGNPPVTTVDPWDRPPFVHWDLREFPACEVPYAVNPNATNTSVTDASLIAGVQAAFDNWEAVAPSIIRFIFAQPAAWNAGQNYFVNDGWNVVSWRPLGAFGISGQTRFRWNNQTGALMESDIALNDDVPYQWGNTPQDWTTDVFPLPGILYATDVESVTTHEVGHVLGLAHVPNSGAATDPTMSYSAAIWGNDSTMVPTTQLRSLAADDRDGCNFLYTPDLGDAPDPAAAFNFYPSKVHGPIQWATLNDLPLFQPALGAYHFYGIRDSSDNLYRNGTYQFEWLGPHIDDDAAECEALVTDLDDWDDGVEFLFDWWGSLVGVRFEVSTNGRGLARYSAAAGGQPMYVNAWLDINNDKDWADPGERLVDWTGGPGSGFWIIGNSRTYTRWFDPVAWPDDTWFRIRLDWGEQVGRTQMIDFTLNASRGAAQLGEVEDYPKGTSFEPFHGWHYGYDYFSPSTWPTWSYPGIYEPTGTTAPTISINTPWWWNCYTFPPPVESYRFGIALPTNFLDQGWSITDVSFREYSATGGGTLQATLTPDENISAELNGDFPMDDGTVWFGYTLENYTLPDTTMVLFTEITGPPTWSGFVAGDFHFIAGDTLYGWSPEPYIDVPVSAGEYVCGDSDGNGNVSITDAVHIINYIFGGGPAPIPLEAADADCNGNVAITDAVYIINFIFGGGPAPCVECP